MNAIVCWLLIASSPGSRFGLPQLRQLGQRLAKPSVRASSAPPDAAAPIEGVREIDSEQLVLAESIVEREDLPGITPRELKDQTAESVEYFASERVPSALIAGATLGTLFAYPLVLGDAPLLAMSKRLYILLATASLCNTLTSVFAASLAIVRLLGHEHEPMAKDPLVMMLREVPLFFLAVRAHYLTGLLLFVAALSVRMFTDYSTGSPTFAKGLICLLGATLTFMCALYNSTLIHFSSFLDLWLTYLRVLFARLRNRTPSRGKPAGPVAFIAAGLFCASVCYLYASTGFFIAQMRAASVAA